MNVKDPLDRRTVLKRIQRRGHGALQELIGSYWDVLRSPGVFGVSPVERASIHPVIADKFKLQRCTGMFLVETVFELAHGQQTIGIALQQVALETFLSLLNPENEAAFAVRDR